MRKGELVNSFCLSTNTPSETGQVQLVLPGKSNPNEGKSHKQGDPSFIMAILKKKENQIKYWGSRKNKSKMIPGLLETSEIQIVYYFNAYVVQLLLSYCS